MCEIIKFFHIFDCLPKSIIENIRCFFVTEKCRFKTGYCVTNEDKVYAVGQYINEMFEINKTNDINYALIHELCDKSIEEFFDGYYYMFARSRNCSIFGWGKGLLTSLLGTDSNDNNGRPRKLEYFDDKNIIDISCGLSHCLALSYDGVVYGWGNNSDGQLGIDSNKRFVSIPTDIKLNENIRKQIKSVYCHGLQSYLMSFSGDILQLYRYRFRPEFNLNISQKLKEFNESIGNTSLDQNSDQNKVIEITFLENQIPVSYKPALIVWTTDNVYEYYIESDEMRKTNSEILSKYFLLKPNSNHSTHKTIHLRDNQLFVFKYIQTNEFSENQLLKTNETLISNIKQFFEDFEQKTAETKKLSKFRIYDELPKDIKSDVKCYYFTKEWNPENLSTLFVMSDSKVYGFGYNKCGKLGFGHNRSVDHHTLIPELCDQNIEEFFEGKNCMFARNDKKQIFGWGRNNYGQLGREYISEWKKNLKPQKIDYFDDKNIVQISCGNNHCLALSSDGRVYGWGRNKFGETGISNGNEDILIPIELETNGFVRSVMCFDYTSILINSEGEVIVFGYVCYNQSKPLRQSFKDFERDPNKQTLIRQGLEKRFGSIKPKNIINAHLGMKFVALSEDGSLYLFKFKQIDFKDYYNFQFDDGNSIKPIESEVKFTDIYQKNNKIALQSEECVYELVFVREQFKKLIKTDYLNFYDFYLREYQLIYKTIHITSDGFLITKDIEFNQNYNKTNEKRLEIEDKNIFDNKYDKQFDVYHKIGEGGCGTVIKAESKLDKILYAIKIIKIEDNFSEVLREVKILSKLKSDFVVQYITAWIEAKFEHKIPVNYLYIQMDLCSQSLKEVIKSMDRISDERFNSFKYFICCELSKELIECVDYLHSLTPPIIHRDLKPENVLISDGSDGRFLKLCDFGLAKVFHEQSRHTRFVGTLSYMAPEVMDSEEYNQLSDVYSLALVITQIFRFEGTLREIRDSKDLSNHLPIYVTSSLKHKSRKLVKTLSLCIHSEDYDQRPDGKELLKSVSKWSVDKKTILKDKKISEFKAFLCEPQNEFFKRFFETKSKPEKIVDNRKVPSKPKKRKLISRKGSRSSKRLSLK